VTKRILAQNPSVGQCVSLLLEHSQPGTSIFEELVNWLRG